MTRFIAPLLLAILVLAVDPHGFEQPMLKRGVLLVAAPLLLLAAWPGGGLRRLALAVLDKGSLAFAAMLGCSAAAAAASGALDLTAGKSLATVFVLLLVLVAARDSASRGAAVTIGFALGLGIAAALVAIAQRLGHDPIFVNESNDAVSFFGNTNRAAEFLAPVVAVALAARAMPGRALRGISSLALPLAVCALLLTESRAGVLAAGAGVLALVLLPSPLQFVRTRRLDLALLAIGALLPLLLAGGDAYRLKSVAESEAPIVSRDYSPNLQRLLLLEGTVAMIERAPWLGHGPGSFRVAFPPYRSAEEAKLPTLLGATSRAEDPHDQYLLTAAESGIPAAVALLLFLLLALVSLRAAAIHPASDPLRLAAPACAAGLLALVVLGVFRSILEHPPSAVLLVALAAPLLAARERDVSHDRVLPLWLVVPALLVAVLVLGMRTLGGEIAIGVAARRVGAADPTAAERAFETGARLDPSNFALAQLRADLLADHARVDPAMADEAKRANDELLALDPFHRGGRLRAAARAIDENDFDAARRHLSRLDRPPADRGLDAWTARLAAAKEPVAAARLRLDAARRREISLGSLLENAAEAEDRGDPALALANLEAWLLERPADAAAAQRIASLLESLGRPDDAAPFALRATLCRAAEALGQRDFAAARREIDSARDASDTVEPLILLALVETGEGKSPSLDRLAALYDPPRLPGYFRAALAPLAANATYQKALASLGL
jgi:O-antigen ligase